MIKENTKSKSGHFYKKLKPISFGVKQASQVLQGDKTVTRRVCKDQSGWTWCEDTKRWTMPGGFMPECPYGAIGDVLWIQEPVAITNPGQQFSEESNAKDWEKKPRLVIYRAGGVPGTLDQLNEYLAEKYQLEWLSSSKMPFWAHRAKIKITGTRVEPLQDISVQDITREGISKKVPPHFLHSSFKNLWDFIYADRGYSYDSDPWVWVIDFELVK